MVRAFVMVDAGTGHAEELLDRILGLEHVVEAHILAGDHDFVVEAETEEVYQVIHEVATRIRDLEDVVDTTTYICLE